MASRGRRKAETGPAVTVHVCTGASCVAAGAPGLLHKLPPLLGREIPVQPAGCIGRCDQAPAAMVGQFPVACATAQRVIDCVQDGSVTHEPEGYIGLSQYRAAGGYAMLEQCLKGEREARFVIAALAAAGLPAARQWRGARKQGVRLLAVDASDFRHRSRLERDPHRLLEGLLIAAWACGSASACAVLHPAWHGCRALLLQELARLQAEPPSPALPRLELRSAGDASALAQDFETLFGLRVLLEHGPEWFAATGGHGREDFQSYAN
ncbi:hypothetical protein HHL11_16135 [Ramlibacter sp. G-1-2-2]|uniref:NADH-quinone oxidoreductase subunit F n=1 Tax=Ramlibacter agri TaxID=2728837 RepID=A0A848H9X3_9BURK|nr:hypothetical protein [Ramlibacter agri]NML45283.1 hypothetical protein [Ramlibacter agri]